MAYDPATHRLIMFGGDDADMFFPNDTWAYDPAANTWAELKPSGTTGTTVVASSTTTTTASATKTELDTMMIEQLSPVHAKISSSVLRYPDWSQTDKDDFAWAATTVEAAKERAAGMKAPAGSEEAYKHLTAFLDAETQVIKEMKTNADSKAPKILGDAGTKLLRQATVELGQLVSPAFVQAIASIPPVPTSAHPGPQRCPASGMGSKRDGPKRTLGPMAFVELHTVARTPDAAQVLEGEVVAVPLDVDAHALAGVHAVL